jgi:hypothetical protein
VITGSIARPGDQLAVEVRIVAPVTGSTVATIKEATAGGEMARMLVALRAGVAGTLDSQAEALPAPIAEYEHVTTASFEALRTYTAGRVKFEGRNFLGATELFLQATRLDPDFGLAYNWLGWSRLNSSGRQGAEQHRHFLVGRPPRVRMGHLILGATGCRTTE